MLPKKMIGEHLVLRKKVQGTSLVVQWLRLRLPAQGGAGSIPGREPRILQAKTPETTDIITNSINTFFFFLIFIDLAVLVLVLAHGIFNLSSWHVNSYSFPQVASSSPTRDRTWAPALGGWSLSHCTTREVPSKDFLKKEVHIKKRKYRHFPTQSCSARMGRNWQVDEGRFLLCSSVPAPLCAPLPSAPPSP